MVSASIYTSYRKKEAAMDGTIGSFPIAKGERELALLAAMANRHGLISGATGTGKTVTLQVLAEHFSAAGIPVFMADVKGDLSGISAPGTEKPKIRQAIDTLGLGAFTFRGYPACFWDVFGEQGHPVRTTISDMGPLLLSRLLDLNDTQSGVLSLAFKIADDGGLLLLDMKDLRAILEFVGSNAKEFTTTYGMVSQATIGAIQRGLLVLEEQGGGTFFGEPALDLGDFLRTDGEGRGIVNILAADKLLGSPRVYATFLLWLLAELFEHLPEVGDVEKPRLVFFFDEAHLLFNDAPKVLMEKIEQVIRLIRSKGVGIYFVTQNPLDIPDIILGQLGNRIQHALRAFTPRDQKAVRAAAETFRSNPKLDVEKVISELGVGEALVSLLDAEGKPGIVERARIYPPHSLIGPISAEDRAAAIASSPMSGRYEHAIDRESAYEILKKKAEQSAALAELERMEQEEKAKESRLYEYQPPAPRRQEPRPRRSSVHSRTSGDFLGSIGSQLGRQIARGMLGSILGGRR
jgi:DNA helicase HerA-like ATPase